jgi:hypothetical protein
MSKAMKFSMHPSFPEDNTDKTGTGWFWKMKVGEWAFAKLDVVDDVAIDSRWKGFTNNIGVIGRWGAIEDRDITTERSPDSKKVTIKFYARMPGSAYVYLRDPATGPSEAVEKLLMQVEVITRGGGKGPSLTELRGTRFAINADDAVAYAMNTYEKFPKAGDVKELFKKLPAGANHVVIGSHGGTDGGGALCMFVGGLLERKPESYLGLHNVKDVFNTLKGKVAANCVVWLGGCFIGQNNKFCSEAASASGCPVIAAGSTLGNTKYPPGFVDILDHHQSPKLFKPQTGEQPQSLWDFCAEQEKYQFVVPVTVPK